MVECTAENRALREPFNPKLFYCVEYQGFNEMSNIKIEKIQQEKNKKEEMKSAREYYNKYYPKEKAKNMFEIWKQKKGY